MSAPPLVVAPPRVHAPVRAGDRLAVPAGAALVEAADALAAAVGAGEPLPALRDAARRAGHAWVEALLDGFVLALAAASRGPGAGRRTAAMVRDLGDRVIAQGVRRADGARVDGFVAFLAAHVDTAAGSPVIHLTIDDALAAALAPAVQGEAGPGALAGALHAMIDAALDGFLDEPLAVLGLGAVTRAVVRVGRGAVARRTHAEVDRAVGDPTSAARLTALLRGFVRLAG